MKQAEINGSKAQWLNTQLPTRNTRLVRALEACRGLEVDGLATTYGLTVRGQFEGLGGAEVVYVDPSYEAKAGDIVVIWPEADVDPEVYRLVTAPPPASAGDWRVDGENFSHQLFVRSRRTGKTIALPMNTIAAVHPVIGHGPASRAA